MTTFYQKLIFVSLIIISFFISCRSKTSTNEINIKSNSDSGVTTSSLSSMSEESGLASKKDTQKSQKKSEMALPIEIEKRIPNEQGNEKNDKPKQAGVVRDQNNVNKVLEILLPSQKKNEEDKLQANVKKGGMSNFIACDPKDTPIIRLTETRFIDERFPTISANGEYLVFEGWHRPESGEISGQALYCVKLDKNLGKKILLKNGSNNLRPFFHPHLKEVFFTTDSFRNEFRISSVALESSAISNLNFRKYCRDVIDLSISKNSDFVISYFREGKTNSSIGVVNSSGIFIPEIVEGREVSWSNSGDRIAFVNYNGLYLDVYSAKSDGTDMFQLTTHFGICHHPSFSPDDKWVVFSALLEGSKKHNLFIVSSDGKNLQQITNASENDKNPFWGKNGWIYFETERFEGNVEIAKIDSTLFIKKLDEQKTPPEFLK